MTKEEIHAVNMKYIKESCKSKKCVDKFSNSIEFIKNIYLPNQKEKFTPETKQFIKNIFSLLKSETCDAQVANTSNNASNVNNNGKTDATNGMVMTILKPILKVELLKLPILMFYLLV